MASNIRVVLEVDNKKYIASVKQAESATQAFAQKTERGLGGVGAAFTGVGDKISGLATKLAGLGFAAVTLQAIRFGDSIKDINDATGIAIENVLGFSNAVALNGGSAEGAQKAILKFVGAIDEAAGGSKEMQNAFAGVNVSLQDLANLSEQDLLAKTIQGLAKITNASERVATAQRLLGKEFRAVNLQAVAEGYESATTAAAKYTDSINKTAELQNKLDQAFQKLQLAILKAIEPIAEFVAKLSDEQVDQMVQAVIALGTAFAALAAAAPVLKGIGAIIAGIGTAFASIKLQAAVAGGALASIGGAAASIGVTFSKGAQSISAWWRQTPRFAEFGSKLGSIGKLLSELVTRMGYFGTAIAAIAAGIGGVFGAFIRLLPVIGQVVAAFFLVDGALQLLTGKDIGAWLRKGFATFEEFIRDKAPALARAFDYIRSKFTDTQQTVKEGLNTGSGPRGSIGTGRAAEEERKKLEAPAEPLRKVNTDLAKFAATQREQIINYRQAAEAAQRQLGVELSLVGASEQAIALTKARERVEEDRIQTVQQLEAAIRGLQVEAADDKTGITAQKIGVLRGQIDAVNASAKSYSEQMVAGTQALLNAEAAERLRIGALQEANTLENLRAQLLGYSLTELEKFNQAQQSGDFLSKTKEEVAQLRQQAVARDALTQEITTSNIVRDTETKLLDLQTSVLGRQFSELEKLEQLKARDPGFARRTEQERSALEAQARALDENIAKLREQAFARDLMRGGEDFAQQVRDQMGMDIALTESSRRRIQVEIEGRNLLTQKLREIADRYGDEKGLSQELIAQKQRETSQVTAAIQQQIEARRQLVVEDQAIRDSFAFGWETAFAKYAEEAGKAANQATTYFNTFTRGFEDAIVRFVQTGKFSFKDLANSIIADFARIQAKKALSGLFGGGGGGGLFGSLFSGIGSIFGFANGGNPGMGKPILVGERGPELMIPRNASTIIPNESLGGGSQQVSVVYNIQAVDASSFRSLVARDPEFIYNVTEQGRKGLPGQHRRR
jgi:lambda family phage tail tape measure protein